MISVALEGGLRGFQLFWFRLARLRMIQFDAFQGIDWLAMIAIAGLLALFLFMGRKIAYGILDPWFPIIINQLFSLALLSSLYFNNTLSSSNYYYWLFATVGFLIPFGMVKQHQFPLYTAVSARSLAYARFANLVIILLSIYQIAFDLAFIANRGIPILYEYGSNPQIYMGGFGIVKYIHDACKYLLPPIAVFSLFATGKRGVFYLALFVTLYPTLLFEWSKAGVFSVLSCFWIASMLFFGRTRLIRRMTSIGIALGAIFVLYMFVNVAKSGYGENAIDALAIRLVQTIDSAYLYFVLDAQASIPKDFTFAGYLISLVTPFFGVDASGSNIGHAILLASDIPAEEGYGPSPPFQVIGHIYMKEFGFVYALLVGIILGLMKAKIRHLKQEMAVFFLVVYNIAGVLVGDVSLFPYYLFILIFLLPPIAFAFIVNLGIRSKNASVFAT